MISLKKTVKRTTRIKTRLESVTIQRRNLGFVKHVGRLKFRVRDKIRTWKKRIDDIKRQKIGRARSYRWATERYRRVKNRLFVKNSKLSDQLLKHSSGTKIVNVSEREEELPEATDVSKSDDRSYQIVPDGGRAAGVGDNVDRMEKLKLILQRTRANIIQNILGHKWMMPSKKELDYYNPSKSTGTISGHLEKLVDEDIVFRVVVPQGERERDLPNTFFALTDDGYLLLEEHSLFLPNWEKVRKDHREVDKTDEIKRYENARRPTISVSYEHPLNGDGISVVDPSEYADEPVGKPIFSGQEKTQDGDSDSEDLVKT